MKADNALKFYAEKFDNQVFETIEVSQQEVNSFSLVDEEPKIAITTAKTILKNSTSLKKKFSTNRKQ